MRKVVVFHPGVQHSWQTARAAQELGLLEYYATSLFYKPDEWPYWLERLPGPLGKRLAAEFRRFANPAIQPGLVRTAPAIELLERLAARLNMRGLSARFDRWGNDHFVKYLARDIRSDKPFTLWGYNNSSLQTFRMGRHYGRTCILDRTNGDFRAYNRTMHTLLDRYGDWFLDAEVAVREQTITHEAHEHALADRILVGSEFAAETVREFAETPEIANKVNVLEYCFDAGFFSDLPTPEPSPPDQPVKFLFLGLVIPRKGIHHVLEAISQFPQSEAKLTIVGRIGIPETMLSPYRDRIDYLPTVPRADVPGIMARHDVLLFPSYFEGAGIVLYEALAAGMGLIQSDRAALAVTSETGILLPEISTDRLVDAMYQAIRDRNRLAHWRNSAAAAAQKYHFSGYVERVSQVLEST